MELCGGASRPTTKRQASGCANLSAQPHEPRGQHPTPTSQYHQRLDAARLRHHGKSFCVILGFVFRLNSLT